MVRIPAGTYNGASPLTVPYRFLLSSSGVEDLTPSERIDGDTGSSDIKRDLPIFQLAIPADSVPKNSSAKILRSAVLNCPAKICQVVMAPPAMTR
jgi:hypothetical protein